MKTEVELRLESQKTIEPLHIRRTEVSREFLALEISDHPLYAEFMNWFRESDLPVGGRGLAFISFVKGFEAAQDDLLGRADEFVKKGK